MSGRWAVLFAAFPTWLLYRLITQPSLPVDHKLKCPRSLWEWADHATDFNLMLGLMMWFTAGQIAVLLWWWTR